MENVEHDLRTRSMGSWRARQEVQQLACLELYGKAPEEICELVILETSPTPPPCLSRHALGGTQAKGNH